MPKSSFEKLRTLKKHGLIQLRLRDHEAPGVVRNRIKEIRAETWFLYKKRPRNLIRWAIEIVMVVCISITIPMPAMYTVILTLLVMILFIGYEIRLYRHGVREAITDEILLSEDRFNLLWKIKVVGIHLFRDGRTYGNEEKGSLEWSSIVDQFYDVLPDRAFSIDANAATLVRPQNAKPVFQVTGRDNHADTIKRLQIYGERCSGTVYLESLLVENLKYVRLRPDFGWKHFFHEEGVEQASDHLFIVIYRNPLDWLRSLHKNTHHAAPELRQISFSEFIRKQWWCVWDEHANVSPDDPRYGTEMMDERSPQTNERFPNVIKMRSAKITNWESLKIKTKHHIYIKYEDLCNNPKTIIDTISDRFKIRKKFLFKNISSYKGGKNNYTPNIYAPISQDDYSYIYGQLDLDLEESIGYKFAPDEKHVIIQQARSGHWVN